MSRTLSTTVIEIKPALRLQIIDDRRWIVTINLRNDIAPCGGFRVNAEKGSQPVMTVHHPEFTRCISYQWNGLFTEIVQAGLRAVTGKINLTSPHLGVANAPLGGVESCHRNFDQRRLWRWLGNVLISG